jgi:hypothetical protein
MDSENVYSPVQTGSERRTVKVARMTRLRRQRSVQQSIMLRGVKSMQAERRYPMKAYHEVWRQARLFYLPRRRHH